jgi:16S rRNA (guanine527-N7)-methyltransferase
MQLIQHYFPELTDTQKEQFARLFPLYREWNEKINVISRKDIENFEIHHLLHSLSAAKILTFLPKTKVLDVGTGGGLPGIPLAILFPEVQFRLMDSVQKKIRVATDIIEQLGLKNVQARVGRVEECKDKFDFVLARGVAQAEEICQWTKGLIVNASKNTLFNGWLLYKGGELGNELAAFEKKAQVFELKTFFTEEFFESKKIVYIEKKV